MTMIIIENKVMTDGIGDYYHCLDLLKAIKSNPKFAKFTLIPIINTDNLLLKEKIANDFDALAISEYYIVDSSSNAGLDEVLKSIYERADQVIGVSEFWIPVQRRFLKPRTPIKYIWEHEKEITPTHWQYEGNSPVYSCTLGLSEYAQGIKIAEIKKGTPNDFFSTLQIHDQSFASKLLTTTHSANFDEFLQNNTFAHAYFTNLSYRNGFSIFLALLCSNHALKQKTQDIVIHLSSAFGYYSFQEYLHPGTEYMGIRFFKFLTQYIPNLDIKHIELFGKKDKPDDQPEKKLEDEVVEIGEDTYLFPINATGSRIIRIYSEFLSKESFRKIHNATTLIVGVSGDNTFEASVAAQTLPFYHSTNLRMKWPTYKAIRTIVETIDFGFSPSVQQDLVIYFSYSGLEVAERLSNLFRIDLDAISQAWPVIADYLKKNKNFYHVYESFIMMEAPQSLAKTSDMAQPLMQVYSQGLSESLFFKHKVAKTQWEEDIDSDVELNFVKSF